jgi:hypothetical protein
MDLVNNIADWENGEMDDTREDSFFQELVDSGMAWQLQGMYGRRAMQLLAEGRIFKHANV